MSVSVHALNGMYIHELILNEGILGFIRYGRIDEMNDYFMYNKCQTLYVSTCDAQQLIVFKAQVQCAVYIQHRYSISSVMGYVHRNIIY